MKSFDRASPKLYQALISGERMTRASIKWYRVNNRGAEEHYFTVTLFNARIVSIESIMLNCLDPSSQPPGHHEHIMFLYERIVWKWEADNVEAEDDAARFEANVMLMATRLR